MYVYNFKIEEVPHITYRYESRWTEKLTFLSSTVKVSLFFGCEIVEKKTNQHFFYTIYMLTQAPVIEGLKGFSEIEKCQ